MRTAEDILREYEYNQKREQEKAKKVAELKEKYRNVPKDEQGRVGLPMSFSDVLGTYGVAASELVNDAVRKTQEQAKQFMQPQQPVQNIAVPKNHVQQPIQNVQRNNHIINQPVLNNQYRTHLDNGNTSLSNTKIIQQPKQIQSSANLPQTKVNPTGVAYNLSGNPYLETVHTTSTLTNNVPVEPIMKPQSEFKTQINSIGDKILRYGSHMPSAMVLQNVNPITQQKLYKEVATQANPAKETQREINIAGTRSDYEQLKKIYSGEAQSVYSKEDFNNLFKDTQKQVKNVENLYKSGKIDYNTALEKQQQIINDSENKYKSYNYVNYINNNKNQSLVQADIQRKFRNFEVGNTLLNAAMVAGIAIDTLGAGSMLVAPGQIAVKGGTKKVFSALMKKEFIANYMKAGATRLEAETAFNTAIKSSGKNLVDKSLQQAEQKYIQNALIKNGIYNQTTNALANSGLNIAKNTAAGAIDLGILGTGENVYSNYLGLTKNNPLEGGYETVQSAMPYMLGLGVAGESIPYIMKGLGKIPYSSKYEPLKNELRPYKENPNIKYGYNNGKGFYMYDGENINPSAEKTNITQPQQQYNQPGQNQKLLTTSGEDISEIVQNIAKKQSANKVTPTPGVIQTPEITQTPQENISDIAPNIAKKQNISEQKSTENEYENIGTFNTWEEAITKAQSEMSKSEQGKRKIQHNEDGTYTVLKPIEKNDVSNIENWEYKKGDYKKWSVEDIENIYKNPVENDNKLSEKINYLSEMGKDAHENNETIIANIATFATHKLSKQYNEIQNVKPTTEKSSTVDEQNSVTENEKLNIYNFVKGDIIEDFYGGTRYEVIEPDKKGMGHIKNLETGEVEVWNAYNNPRFSKVQSNIDENYVKENQKISNLTEEQQNKLSELDAEYKKYKSIIEKTEKYEDEKGKKLKGLAMEYAAKKRNIIQGESLEPVDGGLTGKELKARKDRLASNYNGKEVYVNGKKAKIVARPFGRVKVQFEDGTTKVVEKENISTEAPATEIEQIAPNIAKKQGNNTKIEKNKENNEIKSTETNSRYKIETSNGTKHGYTKEQREYIANKLLDNYKGDLYLYVKSEDVDNVRKNRAIEDDDYYRSLSADDYTVLDNIPGLPNAKYKIQNNPRVIRRYLDRIGVKLSENNSEIEKYTNKKNPELKNMKGENFRIWDGEFIGSDFMFVKPEYVNIKSKEILDLITSNNKSNSSYKKIIPQNSDIELKDTNNIGNFNTIKIRIFERPDGTKILIDDSYASKLDRFKLYQADKNGVIVAKDKDGNVIGGTTPISKQEGQYRVLLTDKDLSDIRPYKSQKVFENKEYLQTGKENEVSGSRTEDVKVYTDIIHEKLSKVTGIPKEVLDKSLTVKETNEVKYDDDGLNQSAMYKEKSAKDIKSFYNKIKKNPPDINKVKLTLENKKLSIPGSVIKHSIIEHSLSANQWKDIVDNIDNMFIASKSKDANAYSNDNYRIGIKTQDNKYYGLVIGLNKKDNYICTVFNNNTEKGIMSWVQERGKTHSKVHLEKSTEAPFSKESSDYIINKIKENFKYNSDNNSENSNNINEKSNLTNLNNNEIIKGSYNPQENIIEFFKGADESTSTHEVAHYMLETWNKYASESKEIAEDLAAIRDFVSNKGEQFTEEQHEKFSRAFERYIRDGKVATSKLKQAFERFKEALKTIYKSIKDIFYKSKGKNKYFSNKEMDNIDNLFNRIFTTAKERVDLGIKDKNYIVETPEFKKWSNNAPYVSSKEALTYNFKTGEKVVVEAFHGTKRADRVGSVFLPGRATSGPMAMFSSNREISEGYAKNKSDTSISAYEDTSYSKWFKINVNGRKYDLDNAWWNLSSEQRETISKNAPHITNDDMAENIIYDENTNRGLGNYDYVIKKYRGNALKALVDGWLEGGNLYNREEEFQKVLELSGINKSDIIFDSPYAEHPGVYDVYIQMQKPLVTNDIPQEVISKLEKEAKKQPIPNERGIGVDLWDKNVQNPNEWISILKEDYKNGENSFAWSSIPDWVTNTLKSFGYDGIIDMGGKSGGEIHKVYIPFESTQIKSVENKGAFNPDNPDIYYQTGKNSKENKDIEQEIRDTVIELDGIKPIKRSKVEDLKNIVERTITPISTRLEKISPVLKYAIRKFEYNLAKNENNYAIEAQPFLDKLKTMSKEDYKVYDFALKNSNKKQVEYLNKKYGIEKEYLQVRKLLENIRKDAIDVGMDVGIIEDYFPRKITDSKKFLKEISKKTQIEDYLRGFENLSDDDKANKVNNAIRGFNGIITASNSHTKSRKINELTALMNAYYKDSKIALSEYLTGMNKAIQTRKFFGNDKKFVNQLRLKLRNKKAKLNEATDSDEIKILKSEIGKLSNAITKYENGNLEDSIGAYIKELIDNKQVDAIDEGEIKEILNARFNEKSPGAIVTALKNMGYLSTMGNFNSAITQIGDFAWTLYRNGFLDTVAGVKKSFSKDKITKKDLGIDKIAQEFEGDSASSKMVNSVFKLVGLDFIDSLGKETFVNANLKNLQREATEQTEKMRKRLNPIFDNETDSVIKDLQNGNVSDNVKFLLFNEISEFQPISNAEMPQNYLTSGNGRIFYSLKSYSIKQFDVLRNQIFNQYKNAKTPKEKAMSIKNAIILTSLIVGLGGAADVAKDVLLGRKIDLKDTFIDNLLKLAFLSRYQLDKGNRGDITSILTSNFSIPQLDWINNAYKDYQKTKKSIEKVDDIGETIKNYKSWKNVPVVGKYYYNYIGKGADYKKKDKEAEQKTKSVEYTEFKDEYKSSFMSALENNDEKRIKTIGKKLEKRGFSEEEIDEIYNKAYEKLINKVSKEYLRALENNNIEQERQISRKYAKSHLTEEDLDEAYEKALKKLEE